MRSAKLFRFTKWRSRRPDWFVLTNALVPEGPSLIACISSRITTAVQVGSKDLINYGCCNEPFAASPFKGLCLDMHGLIFETSVWLLAGSTRYLPSLSETEKVGCHSTQLSVSITYFGDQISLHDIHRMNVAKVELLPFPTAAGTPMEMLAQLRNWQLKTSPNFFSKPICSRQTVYSWFQAITHLNGLLLARCCCFTFRQQNLSALCIMNENLHILLKRTEAPTARFLKAGRVLTVSPLHFTFKIGLQSINGITKCLPYRVCY